MNSVTLKNVVEYWESVLSDPAMQEAWKNYDALKGEPKVSNDRDDDSSPISRVIEDLKSWTMSESPDTPINAQRLKFLQQFAKVQITALEKASLSFGNDPEKQKLMAHLKTRLAEIESILPPESIERLSKNARNQQRLDEGQAAMLNRYRNWQAGTLSDDQRNVLKALQ